MHKYKIEMFF